MPRALPRLLYGLFALSIGALSTTALATMPTPSTPASYACRPLGLTVMNANPAMASPLGTLTAAGQLALLFELDAVSSAVDIYIAARLPDQSLWLLSGAGPWLPYPQVPAFRSQLTVAMALNTAAQNLFMAPLASLPPGSYALYAVVVPAGTDPTAIQWASSPYYLWCFTLVTPTTPTPPPPTSPMPPGGAAEAALLNFAETWAQNWNNGGHTIDTRFTSNFGYWAMDEATYEPWLFDRASVAYYLYQATGNARWRDQFLVYFNFYRTHIDAQGIFTPKGSGDTKYSYVTPFLLYERETGDAQYRPIAKRIYDRWVAEFPNNYSTAIGLWTEREIGFALEAAVSYYELTLDGAALARARALLNHWDQACAGNRAPLHTLEQHGEEFGNAWATRRMTSPWMSSLYFQAAIRLHRLTGDTQPLQQLSRYADWLDQYAFVDAAVTHPEHAGYFIPYYLVGEDGPYTAETPDWGDADHAYDVGNLLAAAVYAKSQLGQSTSAIQTRRAQMNATALNNFEYWTRSTLYLPKYRLSPPRKFNWWYRSRTLQ